TKWSSHVDALFVVHRVNWRTTTRLATTLARIARTMTADISAAVTTTCARSLSSPRDRSQGRSASNIVVPWTRLEAQHRLETRRGALFDRNQEDPVLRHRVRGDGKMLCRVRRLGIPAVTHLPR